MRVLLALLLALPCAAQSLPGPGQSLPGMQLIQPDGNGYPALVATPCGEPEPGEIQSWATPTMVWEDSMAALFVDQKCIVSAVQTGYGATGKYAVEMYSWYKSSDYPCKVLLKDELAAMTEERRREFQSKYAEEYQRECKLMGYKVRWMSVDTRAKKFMVTHPTVLDIKGYHAFEEKTTGGWSTLADLEKDPKSKPMAAAIRRTTALVEKESAYFNHKYR